MNSNDLTCQELVELVTDYLEMRMSAHARARFEAHLAACEGCRDYLEQMRRTIQALGQLTEDTIPSNVRDQLLKRFRTWKQS